MSWKILEINDSGNLGLFGIWNFDCCSISLKFEIPSTFLGKNVMEISSKMTWKVLEIKLKNVLESPGNGSRHLSGNPV